VRLARLSVGGVALETVRATVTDGGLKTSLLGMSFLGRLSGFAVRNRVLTPYQEGRATFGNHETEVARMPAKLMGVTIAA
jgi:hypothetical protein